MLSVPEMTIEHQITLLNFKFIMELRNYVFKRTLNSETSSSNDIVHIMPLILLFGVMISFESNPFSRYSLAVKMA